MLSVVLVSFIMLSVVAPFKAFKGLNAKVLFIGRVKEFPRIPFKVMTSSDLRQKVERNCNFGTSIR